MFLGWRRDLALTTPAAGSADIHCFAIGTRDPGFERDELWLRQRVVAMEECGAII